MSDVEGAAILTGYLDVIHEEVSVVANVGVIRPAYIHNGTCGSYYCELGMSGRVTLMFEIHVEATRDGKYA